MRTLAPTILSSRRRISRCQHHCHLHCCFILCQVLHHRCRSQCTDVRTGCFQGAIKKRVEEGADINAKVMAGTWKGCTCYDLASTEKLRDFIRDLGGGPSQPAFPEYSLEKPHIPRPKTAVRSRHVYTEQEIADLLPDSRRSSASPFPRTNPRGSSPPC